MINPNQYGSTSNCECGENHSGKLTITGKPQNSYSLGTYRVECFGCKKPPFLGFSNTQQEAVNLWNSNHD